jgi:hypothetical protein
MHLFRILYVIKVALIIRYKSIKQFTIEEFKTPFEIKLDR